MDDYQTWATGGLETSMFTLLSVAGVLLASEPRAGTRRLFLAGSSARGGGGDASGWKREIRPAELPALGRQSRVALGRASWQSDDVIDLPDQER